MGLAELFPQDHQSLRAHATNGHQALNAATGVLQAVQLAGLCPGSAQLLNPPAPGMLQGYLCSENVLGCFLQVAIVMRMIFLMPSSQSNIRKLLEELFMAVVLQISFTMKNPQEGCCCFEIWKKEAEDRVVNRRRCPAPACWCLPWARARARLPPVTMLCSVCRCVMRTMQAFFHLLGGDSLVEDIEGEGAWNMLMSPSDYLTGIRVLSR